MFSVNFKFDLGQAVQTDLGELGIVIMGGVESLNRSEQPLYMVHTRGARWWYAEERLRATDDRPRASNVSSPASRDGPERVPASPPEDF